MSVFILNGQATGWKRLAPASASIPSKSPTVALDFLSRQFEWWPRKPLEERPAVPLEDLARARRVDYSGEEVPKALPLRLEELAPGLPEDGVAGSVDSLAMAFQSYVDSPGSCFVAESTAQCFHECHA